MHIVAECYVYSFYLVVVALFNGVNVCTASSDGRNLCLLLYLMLIFMRAVILVVHSRILPVDSLSVSACHEQKKFMS